jgi:hypothetical protein
MNKSNSLIEIKIFKNDNIISFLCLFINLKIKKRNHKKFI